MADLALAEIADAINREHDAAVGAARTAIEHAAECGRLLQSAKAACRHGEWLPWVEANLSFGDRQARKYMRLADHAEQIGIGNSDLTIDGALEALAEPRETKPAQRANREARTASRSAPSPKRPREKPDEPVVSSGSGYESEPPDMPNEALPIAPAHMASMIGDEAARQRAAGSGRGRGSHCWIQGKVRRHACAACARA